MVHDPSASGRASGARVLVVQSSASRIWFQSRAGARASDCAVTPSGRNTQGPSQQLFSHCDEPDNDTHYHVAANERALHSVPQAQESPLA